MKTSLTKIALESLVVNWFAVKLNTLDMLVIVCNKSSKLTKT